MKKARPITGGLACRKCFKPMQRYEHTPAWKPKPGQPYYFIYWDRCRHCYHLQHYEAAKVHLPATRPSSRPSDSAQTEG